MNTESTALLNSISKWENGVNGRMVGEKLVATTLPKGAFSVETEVDFFFQHQYDQAGLMVRVSPECWIKSSIEYEPHEENWLGAVVTNNGFSDWSTQKLPDRVESLQFRISRAKSDYLVQYRESSSDDWVQLRLAHLEDSKKVQCGLYACCPKKNGFTAGFHYLEIISRS